MAIPEAEEILAVGITATPSNYQFHDVSEKKPSVITMFFKKDKNLFVCRPLTNVSPLRYGAPRGYCRNDTPGGTSQVDLTG